MAFKEYLSIEPTTKLEIGFKLDGMEFTCLDNPPSSVWDGLNNNNVEVGSVIRFISDSIADDVQRELFMQKVEDRKRIIPIEVMSEICLDLIGQYSGRPSQRPNGSSVGPANGALTSVASSDIKE